MNKKTENGVIGITDEGQPIITADYSCIHFSEQSPRLTGLTECWYCKFADFRKSCDITLNQSICRCPLNRINVIESGKNERLLRPASMIDRFVSNIKGGVITCIFNKQTLTSKAVYINDGWTAITGYTLETLNREKNGNPHALVYPEDKATVDFEYNRQINMANEYALLYRVICRNGSIIWVVDRGIISVLANGDIQNQSIITEVTEIKEQEARLQHLSQIDQLTDLYNKVTFAQQAQLVLTRQCDRLHANIILDLDDFRKINDRFGHSHGDTVLEVVADCLKSIFRNRDMLGRIGGDEFAILMTDIPDKECAERKIEEICTAIRGIKIDRHETLPLTASLGIAFSAPEQSYAELFKQASTALSQAKHDGKNQYAFFKLDL